LVYNFYQVRAASDELDRLLKKEVRAFRDELRSSDGLVNGQISLEFYQKKRAHWPFPAECIPWEIWIIKINVVTLPNEHGMLSEVYSTAEILKITVLK